MWTYSCLGDNACKFVLRGDCVTTRKQEMEARRRKEEEERRKQDEIDRKNAVSDMQSNRLTQLYSMARSHRKF